MQYYPGTSLHMYVLVPFEGACALLCTHEDGHTSVRMYSVWLLLRTMCAHKSPELLSTTNTQEVRSHLHLSLFSCTYPSPLPKLTRTCPSCGCFHVSTSALSAEAVVLVTRAALETIPDLGTSMESNSPGFHIVASMNKVFPTKIPQQRNE